MSSSDSSDESLAAYGSNEKIAQVSKQFEQKLRRGSQPRIEDHLQLVDAASRDQLLRDLVAVEIEILPLAVDQAFADYRQRFPEASAILDELRKEIESIPGKSQITSPYIQATRGAVAQPALQIRHFKLLEIAGRGGFGAVWRAMDLQLQREVAVKIAHVEWTLNNDVSVLMHEARSAARLRHPNIVTIHEVGEENGVTYIVSDFIDGQNLQERKKHQTFTAIESARLVAKIAEAVQHAHSHGVIHRDLKLANVIMDQQGEPHVTDFGLAKPEARDEDILAVQGQMLGTPAYMAPEQARADHESTDRRTDIYGLGVMLYELLTGKTPYRGAQQELLRQILSEPPIPPRALRSDIPKDLEAVCMKCLSKEGSDRYESAQALADDLNRFLNGEVLRGIAEPLPHRIWKWLYRHRRNVISVMAVAMLVAVASYALAIWNQKSLKPTEPFWPVSFVTDPPGCEITAVKIDPETGEPDPDKIQHARGRTPLQMNLVGGDYLVVAVLDSRRFHEVLRHVPIPNEAIPFGYRHLQWKKNKSGVIEFAPIKIPGPDLTQGMSYCEGATEYNLQAYQRTANMDPTLEGSSWRIPAFYVDRRELNPTSLGAIQIVTGGSRRVKIDGDSCVTTYYGALLVMEELGKRLPSAAEMHYLANLAQSDESSRENSGVLPDKISIEGLDSGHWEWTTTLPGGPFSGCKSAVNAYDPFPLSRMTSAGENRPLKATPTGMKIGRELELEGVRGVRSAVPRRRPQDFVAHIKSKSH